MENLRQQATFTASKSACFALKWVTGANVVLLALALCGCGSKPAESTATAPRGIDAETQKVLSNPNASADDKQKAILRIQNDPKLAESEKLNYIEKLKR